MYQAPKKTLYQTFNVGRCSKVGDILKTTKTMILNNKNYDKYSSDYKAKTRVNTFKEPKRTSYPVLINEKYLSMIARRSVYDSHQSENLETIDTSGFPTVFSKPSRPQTGKVVRKKKPLRIQIIDHEDSDGSEESSNSVKEFFLTKGNSTITEKPKKRTNRPASAADGNAPMLKESIFILRDILFPDERYDFLKYDESEIYHKPQYYENFIHNKLLSMKTKLERGRNNSRTNKEFSSSSFFINNNSNNTNSGISRVQRAMSSSLSHNFDTPKGKIELKLFSVKLSVTSMDANKGKPPLEFEVPFEYVPIFFLEDFETVKEILLSIVKFDFGEISIRLENFQSLLDNLISADGNFIRYVRRKSKMDVGPSINKDEKEYLAALSQISGKPANPTSRELYVDTVPKKIEKMMNLSAKRFNTVWITPGGNYQIQIKMPEIILKFKKLKKEIGKFMNNELFLFLLERDFQDWDFYLIYYLFSFKNFRLFISNTLSKTGNFYYQKYLNVKTLNGIEYISLTNSHYKNKQFDLNDEQFSLILTDELESKNHLLIIHSYSIDVYNEKVNRDRVFQFDFSFQQMKIISLVIKRLPLQFLIQRLLIVDRERRILKLDYSFFDLFNGKTKAQIEEHFDKINLLKMDKSKIKYNQYHKLPNELQIKIINPYYEILDLKLLTEAFDISSDHWELKRNDLSEEIVTDLIESDIKDWVDIIAKGDLFGQVNELNLATCDPGFRKKTWKMKKRGSEMIKKAKLMTPKSQLKGKFFRYASGNIGGEFASFSQHSRNNSRAASRKESGNYSTKSKEN